MKIVHYHKLIRLEKGGVVRGVIDLCTVLAAAGHDVTVVTADRRDAPDDWKDQTSGRSHVIEMRRPWLLGGLFARSARRALAQCLRGADILHIHGMWDPFHVQCAAAARELGLPYVFSVHGMLDDWAMSVRRPKKRVFLAAFGRKLLHAAAAVHCTTQAELDQARKWLPRSNGVVIPLVVELSTFRELPGPELARQALSIRGEGRPTVLFLSRLHPVKGVELLIEAIGSLRAENVDCDLLIAGTGERDYLAKLQQLTRTRDLDDRVCFLGFVSGREKVSLYEAADVFCLPSKHENFGMVWAESLACATPVVTTRGIGAWPDLEAGGGALIVERTAESFADAIKRLVRDPAQRRTMGEKGRQWILSFLDCDRIVARFESMYAEAMRGRA
ncbi:MAG: glycosyltransferase [Planctomycetota bacterium]|jgi:glycosyltransferase involved in cell wall biosynthesis